MSYSVLSDTRRARGVGVVAAALGGVSTAWCLRHAWQGCAIDSPDLFGVAVQLLLACALGWASLLVLLAVRALRSPGVHRDQVELRDRLVHRVAGLLLMIGGGLATTTTPHAAASPVPVATASMGADVPDPGFTPRTPAPSLPTSTTGAKLPTGAAASVAPLPDLVTPTWTPPRPPSTTSRDATLVTEPTNRGRVEEVVVRRGDCLWTVVARHLGPRADVALIAAAVHEWHQANRSIIGADPNRLIPGQVLHVPGGAR